MPDSFSINSAIFSVVPTGEVDSSITKFPDSINFEIEVAASIT